MLAVDPCNLDIYTAIVREGFWERSVVRTCCTVLKSGDVFYDVGASGGAVSMAVSTHFRGAVEMVAFEPRPSSLGSSRSRRAEMKQKTFTFSTHCSVIGPGAGELFIPSHSIHPSMIARERRATAMIAPIRTLGRMVYSGVAPPPDAVKIDVEGAEL